MITYGLYVGNMLGQRDDGATKYDNFSSQEIFLLLMIRTNS